MFTAAARPLLFAMLATVAGADSFAQELAVGTSSLTVRHGVPERAILVEVWFPAAAGSRVEDFSSRPPLRAIEIAPGAVPAPADGRRPLVVLSHGNWGTRYSQGWLAMALVRAGYLVLSTTHPGTSADDTGSRAAAPLWLRSRDVSAALDAVLAHPQWSARIDPQRIGFAGHSFGGWTGLSLAGAVFDPDRQRRHCADTTRIDRFCTELRKIPPDAAAAPAAAGSLRDARIKALYLMASGPGPGFLPESLRSITLPVLMDTAEFDTVMEPQANSTRVAQAIPGAREVLRPIGHFSYVPLCKPVIGLLMARAADSPICDEPGTVDRAKVHEEVAREALEFFGASLR